MTDHLSQKQLLRYLDGELSKSSASAATEHLHACWTCRGELDRVKKDIESIVDAHDQIFAPSLPPPPNPWSRLEPQLRATRRPSRAAVALRHIGSFMAMSLRPSLPLATATLVMVLIVSLIWVPVMPCSAKEMLQRVEVADAKRLEVVPKRVIRQRVWVKRTGRQSSTSETSRFESWKSRTSTYWAVQDDGVISDLLSRYKSFGIAPTLPLSPVAFAGWTTAAASEPTASRQSDGTMEVRIVANSGTRARGLDKVTFHVQPDIWHVDELTLSFADAAFEIGEEALNVLEQRDVPKDVLAVLERLPSPPLASALNLTTASPSRTLVRSATLNLDGVELGVRYSLHQIGADIGDSIDISTGLREVQVHAWGAPPERKKQLLAMLGDRPNVHLVFHPEDDSATPAKGVVAIPQLPSGSRQCDERLRKFFGSAEIEENYTRTVLLESTEILARFYALRALAERWPARKALPLPPYAQVQLTTMIQDHARQLHSRVEQLRAQLGPLAQNFGYDIGPAGDGVVQTWQDASISGFDAASGIDRVLRALLTTSSTPACVEEAFPRLQEGLQQIDRAVRALQK